MSNLFECEVRLLNYNFDKLIKRIDELKGYKKLDYEFDDYYFEPISGDWSEGRNLRVRQWLKPTDRPTAIYFSKNETQTIEGLSFKKSLYPDGKLQLYTGELETCFSILRDLNFQQKFKVEKRQGQVWVLPDHGFQIVLEYVNNFGWSGEVELDGANPSETKKEIDKILEALELTQENITFKAMSELFASK
jgi:predicted adenylyl cyclase CyaB